MLVHNMLYPLALFRPGAMNPITWGGFPLSPQESVENHFP